MRDRPKLVLFVTIFVIEAIGFFAVAAVHLGVAVDLPGYVQPRVSAAAPFALCGLALAAAVYAAASRQDWAWKFGIAAQVVCVVALLVIDRILAVTDVTPIYRVGTGVAGIVGILLMTSAGKRALGHEGSSDHAPRS